MKMKKWFIIIFAVLVLAFPVLLRADLTSQSSTGILNISVVTGGSARVESSTFNGIVSFGSIVGTGFTSDTVNASFGFFDTTNKTFEAQPFIDVFILNKTVNGTFYVPLLQGALIYSDCHVGQTDCEPRFQNATPVNVSFNIGILNVTNTGQKNLTQIDYRILDTCSWVNLTFSNSSNVSQYGRTELNTTLQFLYGALNQTESFQIFLWANISTPVPGDSCNFGSEFDVR